jgi:hypothetical protein
MKRKYGAIAERIRAYVTAHPDAKPNEVAAAVKCKVSNVYAYKYKKAKVEPVKALKPQWRVVAALTSDKSIAEVAPVQSLMPGPVTEQFLKAALSAEQLAGFYRGCLIVHLAGGTAIDAACAKWYAGKLQEEVASRS